MHLGSVDELREDVVRGTSERKQLVVIYFNAFAYRLLV